MLRSHRADERAEEDLSIYAIGDIHGRIDLVREAFDRIDAELSRDPSRWKVQVFLGDYIDRGPDSASVIEALEKRQRMGDVVCLRGNHEACLLDFLTNPDTLSSWRQFGGLQTLMSYGLTPSPNPDALERRQLSEQLTRDLPAHHLHFLQALPYSLALGDYFFAHAGVRPGVRLDRQREEDLLWIRDDFLLSEENFGKIVVHGHTPVAAPEFLRNRINIDTGAYATGNLTCLKLRGKERKLL
ncbi:metallophosphoesterase family protein [Bradyrhizobium guangzhouense]|uniref:metallophosphoesterase family protein n=1 Tax=Bradyrhizobium guangzhouense TaxID=1325095 RepID=UPI003221F89B